MNVFILFLLFFAVTAGSSLVMYHYSSRLSKLRKRHNKLAEKHLFATMPLVAIASLMERKDYTTALLRIEELSAKEPGNETLLHLKINCLYRLGSTERALALCDEALDIRFKGDPGFAAKKGEMLMELGRKEESAALVEEWLEKFPDQPRLLVVKARLTLREGKREEAKQLLRRVLEKDFSLELALRSIDELMDDGVLTEAMREVQEARELENEKDGEAGEPVEQGPKDGKNE